MLGKTVGRKTASQTEIRLAACNQIEDAARGEPAKNLRDDVSNDFRTREPASHTKTDGDGRVQMATRDVSDRVRHRHDRKAESEGYAEKSNTDLRKCCRENGGATSTQ